MGMLPAPKGKRFTIRAIQRGPNKYAFRDNGVDLFAGDYSQTLLSHPGTIGVATAYVESGVLRIQRDVKQRLIHVQEKRLRCCG
ncbi:hypothetical protein [Escherichia coli]|uniref:hypothetical protein n=1 Tax=Escherichia coli TaxID=562 RepID=UPI0039881DA7